MDAEIGSLFSPLRSSGGGTGFEAPSTSASGYTFSSSNAKRSKFVGIQNQGATCYLNSLIQAIHMTPEFRHAIYSLPPKTLRFDPQKSLQDLQTKLEEAEQRDLKRAEEDAIRAKDTFLREVEIEIATPPVAPPSFPTAAVPRASSEDAEPSPVNEEDTVDLLHTEKGQFLSGMGFDPEKIVSVLSKQPDLPVQQLINLIVGEENVETNENSEDEAYLAAAQPKMPSSAAGAKKKDDDEEETMAMGGSLFSDDDLNEGPNDRIDAPAEVLLAEDEAPSPAARDGNPFGDPSSLFSGDLLNPNFIGFSAGRSEAGNASDTPSPAPESGKRPIRKIPLALQRLFAQLQTTTLRSVSTNDLTASFGWAGNESYIQQDVHELNRVLFDAIEKSLNKTPVSQLITNLYRGTLKNQIVCLECKTPSIREEHFLDLPLPLLNADSVNRSLANFVEYEKLTDSNQYSCSHCDKKVDALKGVVIKDLPPILILPLLRFEYQFTDAGFERSKNTKDFSFPLTLDMNPFTETGISPLSASISSSSSSTIGSSSSSSSAFTSSTAAAEEALFHPPENPQSPHLYDLFGIVIHKGSSAGFGHYTAYLRDVIPDSGNPAPEAHWYDFDDTTVTPIATTDLLKQFGGKNECAYMLLYRARSLNATVPQPSIPDYINDEIQLEGRFAVRREERRERQLFHTELEVLREGDLVYNAVNHSVSLAPIRSVEQKVARMVPVDLRCSVAYFRRQLATEHAHLGVTDSSVISVLGLRGEALFCHTILETGTEHLQAAGCTKGSKLLLWNGQTLQGTPWNGQGQTLSLNLMHLLAFSTAPGEFPSTSQLISIAETATLADLAALICAVLPPIARPSPDEIGEEEGKTEDAKKEDTATGLPLVYYLTLLEGRTVTPLRFDNSRRLFDCRINTGATITAEAPVERLDLSIAFSIAEHRRYATEVYVFDRATQNSLEAEPLAFNVPDSTTVFNLKKLVIEKLGGVEALGCDISSVQLRQTTIGDAPADILSDESLSIQMSKVYNGARLIIEKGNSSRLRGLVSLKVVVALDDQPPHPIHEVMVNKNWSVVKCTTELLEQIGLEDDSGPFRLRRCKLDKSQQPQPDAHFSHSFAVLKDEGVFDGDSLWLERGRPKARGEFRLAFSRYTYKPFDTNPDLQITEDQLPGFLYSPSLHATVIKNTMLIHCPAFLKELCELSVNNSLSLVQLKDLILPQLKVALAEELPGLLDPETISELSPEQVRVWAGDRLLRRETSSLLSQRIQADQSITLEVVPESLPLMPRSVLLFVHRRIPSLKSFETTHQEIMVDLETDDIRKAIAEAFAIPDPSKICMISKLVPFSLSWRVIIPDAKTAGHSASTQVVDPQDSAAAAVAAGDAQIPAQFLTDMIPEEGIVVDSGKRRQLSDGTPLELPTLMEQSSNSSMFFFPLDFGDDNVDLTLIDSSNNNNNNHDASLTTITPPAASGEDASSTPGVEWECSVCTLLNPPDGSLCNACDTPRPGSAPARKMPARPKPKVRLPTSHMSVARKPARVPLKSVLHASQSRKRPMETISRPFSTNNYYVRDGDVLSFKIIDDDPEHNDIFAFIPANIDTIGLVTRKKLRNREAGSSSSRIAIGSRRGGEVGIQIQVDQFDDSDSSEDDAHWDGENE